MNKQELIGKIKSAETLYLSPGPFIGKKLILDLVKQLDEPQKTIVPQFVADWIEKCKAIKEFKVSLAYALNSEVWSENNLSDKCIDWLYNANNQEIFARAWLDGYEVEKEKRYSVKIKGEIEENLLVYGLGIDRYFFARTYDSSKRNEHTRKELEEAGFYWVFDCPGIEIEEVE